MLATDVFVGASLPGMKTQVAIDAPDGISAERVQAQVVEAVELIRILNVATGGEHAFSHLMVFNYDDGHCDG